jgi:hypothetical protein
MTTPLRVALPGDFRTANGSPDFDLAPLSPITMVHRRSGWIARLRTHVRRQRDFQQLKDI